MCKDIISTIVALVSVVSFCEVASAKEMAEVLTFTQGRPAFLTMSHDELELFIEKLRLVPLNTDDVADVILPVARKLLKNSTQIVTTEETAKQVYKLRRSIESVLGQEILGQMDPHEARVLVQKKAGLLKILSKSGVLLGELNGHLALLDRSLLEQYGQVSKRIDEGFEELSTLTIIDTAFLTKTYKYKYIKRHVLKKVLEYAEDHAESFPKFPQAVFNLIELNHLGRLPKKRFFYAENHEIFASLAPVIRKMTRTADGNPNLHRIAITKPIRDEDGDVQDYESVHSDSSHYTFGEVEELDLDDPTHLRDHLGIYSLPSSRASTPASPAPGG